MQWRNSRSNPGGRQNLAEEGPLVIVWPTSQNLKKSQEMFVNLWMSCTSILAKKTKTPQKTQKEQQPKEY